MLRINWVPSRLKLIPSFIVSHLRVVAVEQIEVMNSRGLAHGVAKALHVPFLQTLKAHCVIF